MSIERISALKKAQEEITRKYEETFRSEETIRDLTQLRMDAMKKIGDYLSDVAKALNGRRLSFEVPVEIYKGYHTARMCFNVDYKDTLIEWAFCNQYIEREKYLSDYYCLCSEMESFTPGKGNEKLAVTLIEKWPEMKSLISESVEEILKKDMKKTLDESVKAREHYLKAANFEI